MEINLHQIIYKYTPYTGIIKSSIRKIHWSRKTNKITGFDIDGNDFSLDFECKEAPWIKINFNKENLEVL